MDTAKAYEVAGQMLDIMQQHTGHDPEAVHQVLSCFHRFIHKEAEKDREQQENKY